MEDVFKYIISVAQNGSQGWLLRSRIPDCPRLTIARFCLQLLPSGRARSTTAHSGLFGPWSGTKDRSTRRSPTRSSS